MARPDLAAWAAEHLTGEDGGPLRLEPWQVQLLERVADTHPGVLGTPRRRDRAALELFATFAVLAMVQPEQAAVWPAPDASGYVYDPAPAATACRSCGATIRWAQHAESGKRMPIDPTGRSHFSTCPQAGTWRKR